MKIAAAYIRVSTDDQLEYSPDSQIKLIRDYAKKNNYIIPEEFIFIDEGISGKTAHKRPEFNRMIAIAKQEDDSFDAILVWKYSRFARNQEESIVYKKMLKKSKVDVISVSEPITDDAFGSLIERIIEWMDEYYVIRLSDEVKRGMSEKATRGEPLCHPPFGYTMHDKQYFPHPEQAPIVKEIFSKFVNGDTLGNITHWIQNMGVVTNRGNIPDRRFVEYILHNPVYAGKIRWCADGKAASKRDYYNPNNIIVDGTHEAIVTDDIFNKAESIFAENKKKYRKYQRQNQNIEFMLKGLVKCSNCGATLTYSSLACPSMQCHNYTASRGCNISHSISINKANGIVMDLLKTAYENESFNIEPEKPKNDENNQNLEALLKREKKKLLKIKEAYTAGIDTIEEYKEQKEQILQTIQAIENEIKTTRKAQNPPTVKDYKKKVKGVIDIIEAPDSSEKMKNEALRTIISKIIYNKTTTPATLDIYFYS